MATTFEPRSADLTEHGLHSLPGRCTGTRRPRFLYTHTRFDAGRARSRRPPARRRTGQHTGRSPNDKFVVRELERRTIGWGKVNRPMDEDAVRRARETGRRYLRAGDLFVLDCLRRRRPEYRLPVRVITDCAVAQPVRADTVHRPTGRGAGDVEPQASTIIHAPGFEADPERRRHATADLDRAATSARGEVLIGGTQLRGRDQEVDLQLLNYLLPLRGRPADALLGERRRRRATSRCSSACRAPGKTTLSSRSRAAADRRRRARLERRRRLQLRGRLLREDDPPLGGGRAARSTRPRRRFGTVLENVVVDERTAGSTSTTTR